MNAQLKLKTVQNFEGDDVDMRQIKFCVWKNMLFVSHYRSTRALDVKYRNSNADSEFMIFRCFGRLFGSCSVEIQWNC